jgi:hypothetical protein
MLPPENFDSSHQGSEPLLTFDATRIIRFLACCIGLLLAASIAGQMMKFLGGRPFVHGFVPKFYLDEESNIPTYFSSTLLLMVSVLLGVIAAVKRRDNDAFAMHWKMLAILFLYLSIDEASALHELLTEPMQQLFGARGLLHFAWIIPGAFFVTAILIAFARFLRHLPRHFAQHFVIAGIAYVGGAIGCEMICGRYSNLYGQENLVYSMLSMLEEVVEMSAMTYFLYALLRYIEDIQTYVSFRFACRA